MAVSPGAGSGVSGSVRHGLVPPFTNSSTLQDPSIPVPALEKERILSLPLPSRYSSSLNTGERTGKGWVGSLPALGTVWDGEAVSWWGSNGSCSDCAVPGSSGESGSASV